MIAKRNPAIDVELETRRLQLAIDANVVTDYTREKGIGGINADRLAASLEQIGETYEFNTPPDASLYFTDAYLPDASTLALE